MADQARLPSRAADVVSALDQAATDGSITQARHRVIDPVPTVTDTPELDRLDGTGPAPGGFAGVRRRLSPRPVPGSRRKRSPAPGQVIEDNAAEVRATEDGHVADEEPTPAEEMDDVGTHDDKAAKATDAEQTPVGAEETPAGGRSTTATKPRTAAEIVAEQKAREKAAAEKAATDKAGAGKVGDETAVTKSVVREPAATGAAGNNPPSGNPLAAAKAARAGGNSPGGKGAAGKGSGKGQAALSRVGSGVKRFRNLIASLVWLLAVVAAAVLALGALFTALDQTNQSNEIVEWVLARGHDLVGPFKDLFRLETAKNTLLVNWGIAALVYLIAGKIVERFVRP
ncbi:hypothetical protein EV643_102450 [Kribbella sp. VKM Ac-2527]|uniref:Uncharacterized protein n=1 Tax=Kribbella caucasensis TaxID=2512215 RepID=A0A4R6KMV9_9ACTN|nr:hypothetical protein [Kribbella sp. VKM Ac-2527]TDO52611.1 hypothetical protein EV643_102450 [Kribbella sp. VKM Ac-2527]